MKTEENFESIQNGDITLIDDNEPTSEDIKDEVERYLFAKPSAEVQKTNGALQDITSQGNIENNLGSQHLLSNLYNSFYNNPNSQLRHILSRQSLSQVDSIQVNNSQAEEQSQYDDNISKDSSQINPILNYLPLQNGLKSKYASLNSNYNLNENFDSQNNVNTLTVLHHNSNKNLHFPNNLLKNSVCSSNTQSTSSLHNENYNTGTSFQNRNSYSNLHRRNSGKSSQGSYSQLNNQKIQNTRKNSKAELYFQQEGNQSVYNSRQNNIKNNISEGKKDVQKFSTKLNLKELEKSNSELSIRDTFTSINQTAMENNTSTGNFSFRK